MGKDGGKLLLCLTWGVLLCMAAQEGGNKRSSTKLRTSVSGSAMGCLGGLCGVPLPGSNKPIRLIDRGNDDDDDSEEPRGRRVGRGGWFKSLFSRSDSKPEDAEEVAEGEAPVVEGPHEVDGDEELRDEELYLDETEGINSSDERVVSDGGGGGTVDANARLRAAERALATERARASAIAQEMGELKESFLEAEMALADARRKLRQAEINALKKAREGMEEELAKSRLNLAATEHLLSNYQREAVQFDTAMQGMEEQIDIEVFARVDAENSLKQLRLAVSALEDAHRRKGHALRQTLAWMEARHSEVSLRAANAEAEVERLRLEGGGEGGARQLQAMLEDEKARREQETVRANRAERQRDAVAERAEEERGDRLAVERGLDHARVGLGQAREGREWAKKEADMHASKVARLEEDVQVMTIQFEKRLADLRAKSGVVDSLEDSVRRETARGQTLASLLSASTDQMRRLQREIKSLSAQAINNKDSTDEIERLKVEVEEARKGHEEAAARSGEGKPSSTHLVERELAERTRGLENAERALMRVEQDLELERGEVARVRALLEEGDAELSARQGDVARLEWELSGLRGDAANVAEQLDAKMIRDAEYAQTVDADMKFLREEADQRKQEAGYAQARLEAVKTDLKETRDLMAGLRDERERLEQQLAESERLEADTRHDCEELRIEVGAARLKIEELEQTCEMLSCQAKEWERLAGDREGEIKSLKTGASRALEEGKGKTGEYLKRAEIAELEVQQLEAKFLVSMDLAERSAEELRDRLRISNATVRFLNSTVYRLRDEQARSSTMHRREQIMLRDEVARKSTAKGQHIRWSECVYREVTERARNAEDAASAADGKFERAHQVLGELLEGMEKAIEMQGASSKRTSELDAKLGELESLLLTSGPRSEESERQRKELGKELERSRAAGREAVSIIEDMQSQIVVLRGQLYAALEIQSEADLAREEEKRRREDEKRRREEVEGKLLGKEEDLKDVTMQLRESDGKLSILASTLESTETWLASVRTQLEQLQTLQRSQEGHAEEVMRMSEREGELASERDELLQMLREREAQSNNLAREKHEMEASLGKEIAQERRKREEAQSKLSAAEKHAEEERHRCEEEIKMRREAQKEAVEERRKCLEAQKEAERERRRCEEEARLKMEAQHLAAVQERERDGERRLKEDALKSLAVKEEELSEEKTAKTHSDALMCARERQRNAERIRAEGAEQVLREREGELEEERRRSEQSLSQVGSLQSQCETLKAEKASLDSKLHRTQADASMLLEERRRREAAEAQAREALLARDEEKATREMVEKRLEERQGGVEREKAAGKETERLLRGAGDKGKRLAHVVQQQEKETMSLMQLLARVEEQVQSAEGAAACLKMELEELREATKRRGEESGRRRSLGWTSALDGDTTRVRSLPSVVTWHASRPPKRAMQRATGGVMSGLRSRGKEVVAGVVSLGFAAGGALLQARSGEARVAMPGGRGRHEAHGGAECSTHTSPNEGTADSKGIGEEGALSRGVMGMGDGERMDAAERARQFMSK